MICELHSVRRSRTRKNTKQIKLELLTQINGQSTHDCTNTARQAICLPRCVCAENKPRKNQSVSLQQIVAAFAADTAFDKAVTLGATLQFQCDFSLCTGADHHFNSFLELINFGPGSKEREKLAKHQSNLKRLAFCLTFKPARSRIRATLFSAALYNSPIHELFADA